jgi:hypothetical protein
VDRNIRELFALALALKLEVMEHRVLMVAAGIAMDADDETLAVHRLAAAEFISDAVRALGISGEDAAEVVDRAELHLASIHEYARGWKRRDCSGP